MIASKYRCSYMICLVIFKLFLIVVGYSSVSAQELTRDDQRYIVERAISVNGCDTPPYCSDAQRNALGELINQDYFLAGRDPEIRALLQIVEGAHTNRIQSDLMGGHLEVALPHIKYTLNRFPNHPKGLLLLGAYARLANNPSIAIPYYEKALRLYPQHAVTHAQYGSYLIDIGRANEGIVRLQKAIEIDSKLAFAYAWLAKAYVQRGHLDLARQSAENAKRLGYKGKIAAQGLEE